MKQEIDLTVSRNSKNWIVQQHPQQRKEGLEASFDGNYNKTSSTDYAKNGTNSEDLNKKELLVADYNNNNNYEKADRDDDSYCFYYLRTASSRIALRTYQYHGEDRSLLYKYILSPLAHYCVYQYTPISMAPNTITLYGLLFMIVSYLLMWYYVPTFHEQYINSTSATPSCIDVDAFTNVTINDSYCTNENILPSSLSMDHVNNDTIPRWIFVYNAIAILIYQTLDNMDGKQARRTNTSTPLGLLFDHGCDAVNSLFGSVGWILSMGLYPHSRNNNDLLLCCIILFGPYAMFYIGTWEQYHTGKLILPIINGPNEGLVSAAVLSIISYVYGPAYWHSKTWSNSFATLLWSWCEIINPTLLLEDHNESSVFFMTIPYIIKMLQNFRNADILVFVSLVGFLQECFIKIYNVFYSHGVRTSGTSLLPLLLLIGCYIVIGMVSRQYDCKQLSNATTTTTTLATEQTTTSCCNSTSSNNSMIWLRMPRTCLHLCAACFVEMVTDLMVAHITSQPYLLYHRWTLIPLVGFCILYCVVSFFNYSINPSTVRYCNNFLEDSNWIDDGLLIYTTALISYICMKFMYIVHEMCFVLNIWCFDIITPRKRKPI